MAQKEVGIGLIGYAFMGKAHSNAYRQVGRFFDPEVKPVMRALCGRNEDNVRKAADRLGWQSYETDYRKLIERPDIDIIDIGTPGNQHKEMAIAAAQAGKTVLCEKPLGNTLSEAREMLDAAQQAKVVNMVCFNYRRVPAIALAKQMIEDGTLGKIYHFRATYLQDWIVNPNAPLSWRMRREVAGSGSLGDLGAHLVDTAHYLIGNISSLTALTETFIKERPLPAATTGDEGLSGFKASSEMGPVTVDDAALFLARFANGAVGTFEATRFALGRKNHNSFEINGSKGSVVFNFQQMNELEYYDNEGPEGRKGFRTIQATESSHPYMSAYWPTGHIIGYEHTFINTIYDLLNAHARGEQVHADFRDGAQVNAVLDAVDSAATSQKWQDVPQI
ncbi:MAG TPA: Gfo/Idh/MocA family oxidoreductase [Abditibacteriaceae bacterium]|nr:Gfo/Idh/MocA family oxidoreductase [Abditibacteriaceae bacterium]